VDLELKGKVALVTGATGGIGRACAEMLAHEGATVRINARSEADLEAIARQIGEAGGAVEVVAGDVTDAAVHDRLLPEGREPDVFVHAAGHRFRYAKLHNADDADTAMLWRVDYDAFQRLAKRCAVPMMARRYGRIIALTSLGASTSGTGTPHYTPVKAALEGLVRALAVDYGRYGITANAVAPGFTRTGRFTERVDRQTDRPPGGPSLAPPSLERATSVRRIADPMEIAAPIVFLCSPAASYVTGTTLLVSGGAHLNNVW
jgi:NAD(P)-dependent dehydrogenase (short-subunit alcohol dehydrogenase family)